MNKSEKTYNSNNTNQPFKPRVKRETKLVENFSPDMRLAVNKNGPNTNYNVNEHNTTTIGNITIDNSTVQNTNRPNTAPIPTGFHDTVKVELSWDNVINKEFIESNPKLNIGLKLFIFLNNHLIKYTNFIMQSQENIKITRKLIQSIIRNNRTLDNNSIDNPKNLDSDNDPNIDIDENSDSDNEEVHKEYDYHEYVDLVNSNKINTFLDNTIETEETSRNQAYKYYKGIIKYTVKNYMVKSSDIMLKFMEFKKNNIDLLSNIDLVNDDTISLFTNRLSLNNYLVPTRYLKSHGMKKILDYCDYFRNRLREEISYLIQLEKTVYTNYLNLEIDEINDLNYSGNINDFVKSPEYSKIIRYGVIDYYKKILSTYTNYNLNMDNPYSMDYLYSNYGFMVINEFIKNKKSIKIQNIFNNFIKEKFNQINIFVDDELNLMFKDKSNLQIFNSGFEKFILLFTNLNRELNQIINRIDDDSYQRYTLESNDYVLKLTYIMKKLRNLKYKNKLDEVNNNISHLNFTDFSESRRKTDLNNFISGLIKNTEISNIYGLSENIKRNDKMIYARTNLENYIEKMDFENQKQTYWNCFEFFNSILIEIEHSIVDLSFNKNIMLIAIDKLIIEEFSNLFKKINLSIYYMDDGINHNNSILVHDFVHKFIDEINEMPVYVNKDRNYIRGQNIDCLYKIKYNVKSVEIANYGYINSKIFWEDSNLISQIKYLLGNNIFFSKYNYNLDSIGKKMLINKNNYNEDISSGYLDSIKLTLMDYNINYNYDTNTFELNEPIEYKVEPHVLYSDHQLKTTVQYDDYFIDEKGNNKPIKTNYSIATWNVKSKSDLNQIFYDVDDKRDFARIYDIDFENQINRETEQEIYRYGKIIELISNNIYFPDGILPDIVLLQECNKTIYNMILDIKKKELSEDEYNDFVKNKIHFGYQHEPIVLGQKDKDLENSSTAGYLIIVYNPKLIIKYNEPYKVSWYENRSHSVKYRNDGFKYIIMDMNPNLPKSNRYFTLFNVHSSSKYCEDNFLPHMFGTVLDKNYIFREETRPTTLFTFKEYILNNKIVTQSVMNGVDFKGTLKNIDVSKIYICGDFNSYYVENNGYKKYFNKSQLKNINNVHKIFNQLIKHKFQLKFNYLTPDYNAQPDNQNENTDEDSNTNSNTDNQILKYNNGVDHVLLFYKSKCNLIESEEQNEN